MKNLLIVIIYILQFNKKKTIIKCEIAVEKKYLKSDK